MSGLEPCQLLCFLRYEIFSRELFSSDEFWSSDIGQTDRQTDRQKVLHKSPPCISTGVLKKAVFPFQTLPRPAFLFQYTYVRPNVPTFQICFTCITCSLCLSVTFRTSRHLHIIFFRHQNCRICGKTCS